MATSLRIATFNLENFDDLGPTAQPSLDLRVAVMGPQIERLRADVLCLQEVNGQESGPTRTLAALDRLVEGTAYQTFNRVFTHVDGGADPFDVRNLVILSRFPIGTPQQIKHDLTPRPAYRRVTAVPPDAQAIQITWERPILVLPITLPDGATLHVIDVHLKSKLPTDVPGQHPSQFVWRTAGGRAEGSFISAMKRLGQALEVRMFIDTLFDADLTARIVVCGDFNADLDETPLEAIRGDVQDTGNPDLILRPMIPCERNIPEPSRFSLYHQGRAVMLDHILASRAMLPYWIRTESHNEVLHDESIAFAMDTKFPESDHAPVVAGFMLPNP